MNRQLRWFTIVVAAQVLFLLGWAGYHQWVRSDSAVILVRGRPVDPRDLLRGDYMTLAYDIDSFTPPKPSEGEPYRVGEDIWVVLGKRDKYYEVVSSSRTRPATGGDHVLVRGTVSYGRSDRVHVNYGVDRYFVPEGKGTPQFKLMEVELSVSPTQRLYIRRVLLDGKAYP